MHPVVCVVGSEGLDTHADVGRESFMALSTKSLRQKCRSNSIKATGGRQMLVERLIDAAAAEVKPCGVQDARPRTVVAWAGLSPDDVDDEMYDYPLSIPVHLRGTILDLASREACSS